MADQTPAPEPGDRGPSDPAILSMIVQPAETPEATPAEADPVAAEPDAQVTPAPDDADQVPDQTVVDDTSDLEPDVDTADDADPEPIEPLDLGPINRWNADTRAFVETLPPDQQEIWVENARRMDASYTQKTQKVSEERRKLDENMTRLNTAQQAAEQRVTHLDTAIQQLTILNEAGLLPQKPDPELIQSDPIEYNRQQALYDRATSQVQQVVQARAEAEAEARAKAGSAREAVIAKETERLRERVPEFASDNPELIRAFHSGVQGVLTEFGATPADIDGLTDHRILAMAAEVHRLRSTADRAKGAIQRETARTPSPAPKPRPKPRGPRAQAAAQEKEKQKLGSTMKRSGKNEDVAAWIRGG